MKNTCVEVRVECNRLLELARAMWPKDEALAKRYVKLAFRKAMHHRIHLGARRFCKKCFVTFVADTLKVRQDRKNKTILYTCRKCNTTRRIPYGRKKGIIL